MEPIEIISWDGQPLTYTIHGEFLPDQTTFLTSNDYEQQLGFIVYPHAGEVKRHVHRAIERQLKGTSEVLVLRKGRCIMDIYNDQKELVANRELKTGDIMLMVSGGHGFRMLEETVFLEVK